MKLQRYFRRADLEAVCRRRRAVACVLCGCRTFDVEVMIFLLDSMREAADRAAAKKRCEAMNSCRPLGCCVARSLLLLLPAGAVPLAPPLVLKC